MSQFNEVNDVLRRMKGATATIWSYSASLEELHVRLGLPNVPGNVHVVCNACIRLQMPTGWMNANLELRRAPDKTYELIDLAAGVCVKCRLVRILENVEPVYD